jgi:4-oxalocrotonate tautomerase
MPIVEITLLEGRSETQKRALVKEVTDAIVSSIGAPKEAVRIIIREIPPGHFAVAGVIKG